MSFQTTPTTTTYEVHELCDDVAFDSTSTMTMMAISADLSQPLLAVAVVVVTCSLAILQLMTVDVDCSTAPTRNVDFIYFFKKKKKSQPHRPIRDAVRDVRRLRMTATIA